MLTADVALDQGIARSYETTRLCQSVDSFLSAGQRIELQVHKVELNGKVYPIISIQGFKEGPLFCGRDFTGKDGKLILKEGAVYIRDSAARTVVMAGPQQFTALLKLAVERRQAEIVQQVRVLVGVPIAAPEDASRGRKAADEWVKKESITAIAEMQSAMPNVTAAHIEIAHYPMQAGHNWSQDQLLLAAQKSICRNTGWPMGVVLNRPDAAPKSMSTGIRASIHSSVLSDMYDYWSLDKQGTYFLLRNLEEDWNARGKGKVFFDIRIWDTAEALLHCSNLYKALDLRPESEIKILISHKGLAGRLLGAANPSRHFYSRKCEEDELTWEKVMPLGAIEPSLESLVGEATGELFTLFEFWRPAEEVWKSVLQEFLKSRV